MAECNYCGETINGDPWWHWAHGNCRERLKAQLEEARVALAAVKPLVEQANTLMEAQHTLLEAVQAERDELRIKLEWHRAAYPDGLSAAFKVEELAKKYAALRAQLALALPLLQSLADLEDLGENMLGRHVQDCRRAREFLAANAPLR